jgi:putative selenium metabolism protein SsnA
VNASALIIKNGRIATLGDSGRVLENHAILVEGGLVSRIAPVHEISAHQAEVLDASGKLVLPGLINAHMHFYSTFARGLYKARPSATFNEILENLWWKLDKQLTLEGTYVSALVALLDCIRKGTTTIIDHHASPGAVRGSLARIAEAVGQAHLRASLCYEVSDRDGEQVAQDGITENLEFISECRKRAKSGDSFLRALFGLHASFTLSDATLARAVEGAASLDAGFHVHVAEAASDQEHCRKHHHSAIVERFKNLGMLGPDSIFAHCVHLTNREIDMLVDSGTKVVHNAQSNMNNAVGIADIVTMSEKGICVGLGTDAMTCNMLEEMRVATWLQKIYRKDPRVGFCEATGALFANNARIADRYWPEQKLGRIEEGSAADLILIDYDPVTPFDMRSLLGHLCFGVAESQVDTTIVHGKILMHNKKLALDIDEERLAAHSRELAAEVWEAF